MQKVEQHSDGFYYYVTQQKKLGSGEHHHDLRVVRQFARAMDKYRSTKTLLSQGWAFSRSRMIT